MSRLIPSSGVFLRSASLAVLLALGAGVAQAGKPQWVEDEGRGSHKQDKGDKHRSHGRDRGDHDDGRRAGGDVRIVTGAPSVSVQIQIGGYFSDAQRHAAHSYYEPRWKAGKCPPGLAKKGNGCLPPGQARHWHRGQPLPRDVVMYPVPDSVRVQLGVPPAGHKYVRVAADILLIAVGTGMVVDAIEDLGRL